ncbi:acyl-coenzyme A diphosphatase FITM2-like [Panonychus citri]|uniref:acyl-coenzyme A diphosphatase FITM2-like n=1 Tax=Panonychus citri TaxID=50023 RepID=UPI002307AE13|nr:acyl-coenzyme A diphosphatase FITM2-like [Panonychus citri]
MTKFSESTKSFLKYSQSSRRISCKLDDNEKPGNTRFIATSTSLSHVSIMILLTLCRKYTIGIPVEKRFFVYSCLIFFGGIICDFAPILIRAFVPFKATKEGFLNQYLVNLVWWWTLLLLIPFLCLTSAIVSLNPTQEEDQQLDEWIERSSSVYLLDWMQRYDKLTPINKILRLLRSGSMIRLIVNLILTFGSLIFFNHITQLTGSCSIEMLKSEEACLRLGHRWSGFVVDDLIFQMLIANLIILEECSLMKGWEPFGEQLTIKQKVYQKQCKINFNQSILFDKLNGYIRILFIGLTLFSFTLDFMIFQYAVYYPTMISKGAAYCWSLIVYYSTYRFIYKSSFFTQLT